MGRMADAMGAIFLGYSTLHHFERNRHIDGLNVLAESAMLQLEYEAQTALREAANNFPAPLGSFGGFLMKVGVSPLGELMRPYRMPHDSLTKEVSRLLSTPSQVHAMFAENVYLSDPFGENRVAQLIEAMPICLQADAALSSCKKEKREPTLGEQKLIDAANSLRDKLIQVDVHEGLGPNEKGEFERPALVGTKEMLARRMTHAAHDDAKLATATA